MKQEQPAAVPEIKEMFYDDWMAEGKRRFGEDMMFWRFVCCNCGHVQSVGDFKELYNLGKFKGSPDVAYFSCVGRFDDRIPRDKIGELGDTEGKDYCNYTLGGLFLLNKLLVIMPSGEQRPVFEFARATVEGEEVVEGDENAALEGAKATATALDGGRP